MKILVVDDDPMVLKAIDSLLRGSGYETACVTTGAEAVAAAKDEEFDLVLLDVILGRTSGIEVCREIKANCDHFLPVVLITARDTTEGRIDGLESGADDYIAKPFDNRVLLARIKALLRIKALHDEVRHLASVREQVVYTVSHDFRTPLVGIRGAIQNLLNGLVGELSHDQREYLELVDEATRRLSGLTDEMCRVAKRARVWPTDTQETVNLKKSVETAAAGLRPEIVKKRIRLDVDTPEDLPPVWGNTEGVVQLIANLLDNAVKHSPEAGRIVVRFQAEPTTKGGRVHLVVSDEGPGIARSDFQRIFYRFEQVGDPEDQRNRGTGLGLAICKETVDAHGGKIWVESELGHGAHFHVHLPAVAPVRGVA